MSARAGVFSKVVKRIELGDPGRGGGVALLLKCGHARTGYKSTKSKRVWCRLCTEAAKRAAKKKPTSYTQAQFDRAVARAVRVARALVRAKATRSPPDHRARADVREEKALKLAVVKTPQTQAERDRVALLEKFPQLGLSGIK